LKLMKNIRAIANAKFPPDEPESEYAKTEREQIINIWIDGVMYGKSLKDHKHDYFYLGNVDENHNAIMVCTICGDEKRK